MAPNVPTRSGFHDRNRCRACQRRWPCEPWHQVRDERDRAEREAAADTAVALILGLRAEVEAAIHDIGGQP